MSDPFSPIIIEAALVLTETICGITERSITVQTSHLYEKGITENS